LWFCFEDLIIKNKLTSPFSELQWANQNGTLLGGKITVLHYRHQLSWMVWPGGAIAGPTVEEV
jgi:hypothetical protein